MSVAEREHVTPQNLPSNRQTSLGQELVDTIAVLEGLAERLQKAKNGDPKENALADRLTVLLHDIKSSAFKDYPQLVLYRRPTQTPETAKIAEPPAVILPDIGQTASPSGILPGTFEERQTSWRMPEVLATPVATNALSVLEPPGPQEEMGVREKLREFDLATIARIKAGDTEAFGELYERYADRVHRHIYYRTGSDEIAEDLTSRVFLNALRAIGRYKDTQRPFVVWLLKIVHNLLVDHYRAKRETANIEDVIIPDQDRTHDPVDFSERTFDNKLLREAIRQLKPDQQLVVVMRYVEEMEYSDIATVLHKSGGAVRVILHRGLLGLRNIMKVREMAVLPEEENKTDRQPSGKRFSYNDLAKVLDIPESTLKRKIQTAEKRGKLEIEGKLYTYRKLTREDLARVLKFLGKDPALAARL